MDYNRVGENIARMLLGFEKGHRQGGMRNRVPREEGKGRGFDDAVFGFGIERFVHEGGRRGSLERIGRVSVRLSKSLLVGFREHRLDRAVYTIVFRWTARVTNSTSESHPIKSMLKGIDQAQQST